MKSILKKTEKYVGEILQHRLPPGLTFHDYNHTLEVVEAAGIIGREEGLSEDDLEVVQLAAWFHDVGHWENSTGHEEIGNQMAIDFFKKEGLPSEKIARVSDCILATKLGVTPKTLPEKVICDADLFHLSKDDHKTYADKLRTEWKNIFNKTYSDPEWHQLNIDFFSNHNFYTDYGKRILNKSKDKVVEKMEKKTKKHNKKLDSAVRHDLGITQDELKSMKKKLLKAQGKSDRGIETMFRLTSRNHLALSGMADSKANIMISVNAIIISVLIVALMAELDTSPQLIAPTIILLAVNLTSIVFAIFAIRPNITKGLFTREDIEDHRTNLLFFGNFHRMKREDYHWGMNQLMENSSFLYSNLIDDIYFLGLVLAKKYDHLRNAYNVFMFGIIVAVIAFVISSFFA